MESPLILEATDASLLGFCAEMLVSTSEWKPATLRAKRTREWYDLRLPFCRPGEREDYRKIVKILSPKACKILRAMFRVARLVYRRSHGRPQPRKAILASFAKRAKHRSVMAAIAILEWGISNYSDALLRR